MKKLLATLLALTLTACMTDAQVASQNLSREAGNFKVDRRIVFYNGITDSYILVIEGKCQIHHEIELAVTCKTGENSYKKHYLGLSDNVAYFAEQLEEVSVSTYHYKVVFRPSAIIPDIEVK